MVQSGENKHRNTINGQIHLTVVQLVSRTQSSVEQAVNTRGQSKQLFTSYRLGGGRAFSPCRQTGYILHSHTMQTDWVYSSFTHHADRLDLFFTHTMQTDGVYSSLTHNADRLDLFFTHTLQTDWVYSSLTHNADRLGLFFTHTMQTDWVYSSLTPCRQTGFILHSHHADRLGLFFTHCLHGMSEE